MAENLPSVSGTGFVPSDPFQAGQFVAEPRTVAGPHQYALVPEGASLKSLENYGAAPSRIRTALSFYEAASFAKYLTAFKDDGTRLFADRAALKIVGFLDYHPGKDTPRWCSHVATLALRASEAWERWTKANGKRMDQVTFASFIEDNLVDIASPDGATLLEMAKNFEIKRAVAFSSAIRLDNGQTQFSYIEEGAGTSQKGALTIPERFVLGLAPVEGVEPYRVDARLRYRLQDGKLAIWFDLLRPEDYLKAAFESVVDFVKAQTSLDVFMGTVTGS
jgi:uncharacterized protein YfdQ (DUF2303 family)